MDDVVHKDIRYEIEAAFPHPFRVEKFFYHLIFGLISLIYIQLNANHIANSSLYSIIMHIQMKYMFQYVYSNHIKTI